MADNHYFQQTDNIQKKTTDTYILQSTYAVISTYIINTKFNKLCCYINIYNRCYINIYNQHQV